MRDDLLDAVDVVRDGEVEAPVLVDASLPKILGLIVLFSVE